MSAIENIKQFVEKELSRRGWSHTMLAKRSGVGRSSITQFLDTDGRGAKFRTILGIAQALDVSLDQLAGLPPQPGVDTLSPEQKTLVEAYTKLDEAHRSIVLGLVQDLAEKK